MNYKDFTKLELPTLEKGTKVTLVKMSDFGYPVAIQLKFDNIFLTDWAQYNNCIQIQGKRPRKRTLDAYLIRPYQNFVLFEGWVEINDTSELISEDNNTTVRSLGTCFDENNLIEACNIEAVVLLSSY